MGLRPADRLLHASDEGVAAMAEAGTIAVMMPTVPITLMDPRWPDARRLLDAGVPVALGTDHNPNNPVTDMGLVAQLACYLLGLTPEQALTAATWNAAARLGRQHVWGSLEPGKRADLWCTTLPMSPTGCMNQVARRCGMWCSGAVSSGSPRAAMAGGRPRSAAPRDGQP